MDGNVSLQTSIMMDNKEITGQSIPKPYKPQVFPSSLRRKPVSNTTSDPVLAFTKGTSHTQSAITTTSRQSFLGQIRTRWSQLRRRNKIMILTGIVAALVLIIGLAAGLTTRDQSQDLPLPTSHGGPYTGDLTYYDPGLGACGITSTSSDSIVAVSHLLFDAASTSSNPNNNPLCRKMIRVTRNGVSKDVKVVDRCVGCQARDLDVTSSVFADLASIDQGRVTAEWAWLEDVPGSAGGS